MDLPFFSIDIEPTNRCNASCSFCPRDATPHQGLMSDAVFDQALHRAVEFRSVAEELFDRPSQVNLCGLGEPLLNKRTPDFVRRVRDAGFACAMASNAALLDERRGAALLDAGLQRIAINVGEQGDDYRDIYDLPFERTRDNILRFHEEAQGRCEVQIVLVNHRGDQDHLDRMQEYWRSHGLAEFVRFDLINRGGALYVDHMQYEALPERHEVADLLERAGTSATCYAPFVFLFIGYDGQYYLCCSDWKKEVPLGSVFDRSFADVAATKLDHATSRRPICMTCNIDPVNRLTDALRAQRAGEISPQDLEAILAAATRESAIAHQVAEGLRTLGADPAANRRLIPVAAR